MSIEHVDTPDAAPRHIPPIKFWKPEAAELYLDEDGSFKRKDTFEQIVTPTYEHNDLVNTQAMVDTVLGLFVDGYHFPRRVGDVSLPDNVDHVQHDENDYAPDHFRGDRLPDNFRNNPNRKIIIPMLIHVVKTELLAKPPMPAYETMRDELIGWRIGGNFVEASIQAIRAGRSFPIRRQALLAGLQQCGSPDDRDGKKMLSKRHRKYYDHFRAIRDTVGAAPPGTFVGDNVEQLSVASPIEVIRLLGGVATDRPWNFAPYIRNPRTVPSPLHRGPKNPAIRTRLNWMERRAA